MKCSICIATYNKPALLERTLASIRRQSPPFPYELIVCDDGSKQRLWVKRICQRYEATRLRIERPYEYRNPGAARNAAYRAASGEVLICQSDDVLHYTDAIEQLVALTTRENMVIASVFNHDFDREPNPTPFHFDDCYSGPQKPYPLFFLGSVLREHVYAIGGNDEEFSLPGYEDNFFSECLMQGRQLLPVYRGDIIGLHQAHDRPNLQGPYRRMREVFERKMAAQQWVASGGPWQI
jgi:glycosyltransferase involved in cell wall biosynthesis